MLRQKLMGGAGVEPAYIEDVFSTWLYTGNAAIRSINNGINLSLNGGLVWIKARTNNFDHYWFDTNRGALNELNSNNQGAQASLANSLTAFNTNGFSLGNLTGVNASADNFVSWTFRKQPKFFDVVTYTGTGANRTIAHNLGSVPGCIIVKRTDSTGAWQVYHRSLANTEYMVLNTTAAVATGATRWNSTTATDTVFSLGTDVTVNASGGTYVAYVFAHNAGGFGLTGTDNVISCGIVTTDAIGEGTVTLGYEPQWVLTRSTLVDQNWFVTDNARGIFSGFSAPRLFANDSGTEGASLRTQPTATGFVCSGPVSSSLIYVAIRRGPMRVPTSATTVFSPITSSQSGGSKQTTGFPVDLQITRERGSSVTTKVVDRLKGISTTPTETNDQIIFINEDSAGSLSLGFSRYWDNTGFQIASAQASTSSIYWNFKRAPGFFDVVPYTGTGANTSVSHNLKAVPELMFVKLRSNAASWAVYVAAIGNTNRLVTNTNAASATASTTWRNTTPTSSSFAIGTDISVNSFNVPYSAYLFATLAGVSKVGSYTGTGTTLQINCGFTGGARFVLIKRTNSIGDWYVWDSDRGIVSGNDPYLLLNEVAAEVTITDFIDPFTTGFELSTTALATVNVSGGTYVFLAIA
jgi:hypothetical protein